MADDYVTQLLKSQPALVAVVQRGRLNDDDFDVFRGVIASARQLHPQTVRSARRDGWWYFATQFKYRPNCGHSVVEHLRSGLRELPGVTVQATWLDSAAEESGSVVAEDQPLRQWVRQQVEAGESLDEIARVACRNLEDIERLAR